MTCSGAVIGLLPRGRQSLGGEFPGIQLGYEGFAPDDADSSSIRFLTQEENLEIQLMAGQPGSDHPHHILKRVLAVALGLAK